MTSHCSVANHTAMASGFNFKGTLNAIAQRPARAAPLFSTVYGFSTLFDKLYKFGECRALGDEAVFDLGQVGVAERHAAHHFFI
jgi:hypothetical protein